MNLEPESVRSKENLAALPLLRTTYVILFRIVWFSILAIMHGGASQDRTSAATMSFEILLFLSHDVLILFGAIMLTPAAGLAAVLQSWGVGKVGKRVFIQFAVVGALSYLFGYALAYDPSASNAARDLSVRTLPLGLVMFHTIAEDFLLRGFLFVAWRARSSICTTLLVVSAVGLGMHFPRAYSSLSVVFWLGLGEITMTTIREYGGFWRATAFHLGYNVMATFLL